MNRIYLIFVLVVLTLSFLLPLSAFAEEEAEFLELEGYVTELMDGGFLMEDISMGSVVLNMDDTTFVDGFIAENGIQPGDYVIVAYDGRLTRSIPPQAHADRVVSYKLTGTVVELIDETTVSIETPDLGIVWVHIKEPNDALVPGLPITAYYDGIMAMSYPGQIAAREVILHQVTGAVEGLDTNSFTVITPEDVSFTFAVDQSTIISRLDPAAEEGVETPETEPALTETVLFPGVMPLDTEVSESEAVPAADGETATETDASPDAEPTAEPEASPAAEEETEQPAALPYDLSEYLNAESNVTVFFAPSADEETLPLAVKILILP